MTKNNFGKIDYIRLKKPEERLLYTINIYVYRKPSIVRKTMKILHVYREILLNNRIFCEFIILIIINHQRKRKLSNLNTIPYDP